MSKISSQIFFFGMIITVLITNGYLKRGDDGYKNNDRGEMSESKKLLSSLFIFSYLSCNKAF